MEPLPWRVRLRGEWWCVAIGILNKSGKRVALNAYMEQGDRTYTLWKGMDSQVRGLYQGGFIVKGGTPERGLVTELRRAGRLKLLGPDAHGRLQVLSPLAALMVTNAAPFRE